MMIMRVYKLHFLVLSLSFKKIMVQLFLTNKLGYITQMNNEIIKSFNA